ncbi:MAG: 1-deoxy-D-xylulose-5-phosphate synthase [Oscillospiraceae bacterium]|nr:1-deoxy-D-xylulose-5-phosphate synthase [Oscillospiraceae bacterium]
MGTNLQKQQDPEIRLADLTLPEDLKKLDLVQCRKIAKEIRSLMVRTISHNGGHLASNLGTVELTLALHRVFDSPQDKLIWDVGHQCYTHKIVTGRLAQFRTIRKEDGISGFPKPSESPHDVCISGHSSTSISTACGIAEAMRLKGDPHHAIAILGDGALTGGLSYEGLNNGGKEKLSNLIVILNDNDMSISANVGAVSNYLRSIREKEDYVRKKQELERSLRATPGIGVPTIKVLKKTKDSVKRIMMKQATMFEQMGFVYLGPVDGHNMAELEEVLRTAKRYHAPVLVHVKTVKGKGYLPAEKNPSQFHGVSQFDIITGNPEVSGENSYSGEFGKALAFLAHQDPRICAITAAMEYGTGLQYFEEAFPDRFYDVGIAEQHAVTFSAGLAASGMVPVFAVYSTFLQRAYDQLIHDVAIGGLHVVLGIDRAGIVGEDGETHQGMFDVPMLTSVPGTVIYSPACYEELQLCLRRAVEDDTGLTAVRYPRGNDSRMTFPRDDLNTDYTYTEVPGADVLLISYGRVYQSLWAAHNTCAKSGYQTSLLKLTRIFPVDEELVEKALNYKTVIFFEESSGYGGISTIFGSLLSQYGFGGRYVRVSADNFLKHASVDALLEKAELSEHAVCRYVYAYGTKS